MVLIERIERRGGERERDAECADQQLGHDHVGDRSHPGQPHPAADGGEQVPPVQRAGNGEADVLKGVHAGVAQGGVVHRGDVPAPHHPGVQDDREGGVGQVARTALNQRDPPGDRSQQHLIGAQDAEDRGDVQHEHVLDHVHHQQLLPEHVDGGDQRDQDGQDAAGEQRQTSPARAVRCTGRSGTAPGQHVQDLDDHRPGQDGRLQGPGHHRRDGRMHDSYSGASTNSEGRNKLACRQLPGGRS